jgi:predicted nucleic acid-binding protein
MIAVDTNILLYAHRGEMPPHALAKQRLVQLAKARLETSRNGGRRSPGMALSTL